MPARLTLLFALLFLTLCLVPAPTFAQTPPATQAEAKPSAQTPHPGTEAMARQAMAALVRGDPDFSRMVPALADARLVPTDAAISLRMGRCSLTWNFWSAGRCDSTCRCGRHDRQPNAFNEWARPKACASSASAKVNLLNSDSDRLPPLLRGRPSQLTRGIRVFSGACHRKRVQAARRSSARRSAPTCPELTARPWSYGQELNHWRSQ
jgi:hypothetical protein